MLTTVFATKIGMTQAWTQDGKRCAVTKCKLSSNKVVSAQDQTVDDKTVSRLEIGYGHKKLAQMSKPLRTKLERSGFSSGSAHLTIISADEAIAAGQEIKVENILQVGDVVQVQGVTKGRGFAGGMKRHGFHGGPATHGQSDRARAVGSIGNRTTPGRVWKGKRMPGHFGTDTQSVKGLVVIHIDAANQEIWLSGPIPGYVSSDVRIEKTGVRKEVNLNKKASGINEVIAPVSDVAAETTSAETTEATA